MNTDRPRPWTSADLELYHDDELAPDERAVLTDALRQDAGLRRELLAIQRADELARAALLTAAQPALHRRSLLRRTLGVTLPLAAAASILLAITLWRSPAGARPEPPIAPPGDSGYQAIRFVTLGPAPRPQPLAPTIVAGAAPDAAAAPTPPPAEFLSDLNQTLVRGDVNAALRLLADAPPACRALGYQRLGEVVRSVSTARQILDQLPGPEQLAVCETWARTPALRSVVYPRLQQLGRRSELAEGVHRLVSHLAEEPKLRDVLRSYQLLQQTY